MLLFSCRLVGRIGIKKNNKRIFARGKRVIAIPSENYQAWAKDASLQLLQAKVRTSTQLPIKGPIRLTCKFYHPDHKWESDLSNMYQGIEDLLQSLGIIENDKNIYSHDGSCKIFSGSEHYSEITITKYNE